MEKRYQKILYIEGLLLVAYVATVLFKTTGWSNLFSAIGTSTAGVLIAYSYHKTKFISMRSMTLLFFAAGCLFWGAADFLWMFSGPHPEYIMSITLVYFMTNVMLMIGVALYILSQLSKWSSIKLLLDAFAIVLQSLVLIWILFFGKTSILVDILTSDGILSFVTILLDFLIVMGALVWFLSMPRGKTQTPVLIIALGIFLFSVNDLYYYYVYATGSYTVNTLCDVLYLISMLIIALGSLGMIDLEEKERAADFSQLKALNRKWIFLLFFPVVAILAEGLVVTDLIILLLIISLYQVASNYVEFATRNERLLLKELELNSVLEKRVAEQVEELSFLANQDTLTKLYNRRYFLTVLESSMEQLPYGENIFFFLFDIDRFKTINDTYGHDVGDLVLIEISNRLTEWNQYQAVITRLGGDEFAILLIGDYTDAELEAIAREIIETCNVPVECGSRTIDLTISLGVSSYPSDADHAVGLMKNADIAMYRAKAQGYNRCVFFDPFFTECDGEKREIEGLLKKADFDQDFELYYQPQFSLPDQKLIGVEALIRWKSIEHGYIPPKHFIPVAEEIDYIIRIGQWVMCEAVRQVIEWNTKYALDLKMGVNISPKQLNEGDFIDMLKKFLKTDQMNPNWIDAEITENIMLEDGKKVNDIFESLTALGVSVSIDDFGSGYSSWGYLNKYPFSRIKIDKALIDNLNYEDNSGVQVVKAIIVMAEAIGKKTIAEGVETQMQLDILNSLGCAQMQGYLLGRPVNATMFENSFINTAKSR